MATPHVAGAMALVLSEYPDLSYGEVLDRIYSSVDTLGSLAGKMVTGGRLNAAAALAAGNGSPIAEPDTYGAFDEDTTLIVDALTGVLANDSDPENDSLTAVLVSGPANGVLTLNDDGSFSYTPDENYNGSDSFTYKATDGTSFSNEVTVTLSVTAVNDAPVAVQDANYSVGANNTLTVNAANGVLTNDSDPDGDSITAAFVSGPSNGTLTLNDNGSFEYTPTNGFSGSDSFTYKANDTQLDSNQITVTIDVLPPNDPPIAKPDTYDAFDEDTTLIVDAATGVLANDSDPENDSLTAVLVSGPANGVLTLNDDGSFSYTPDENYNGSDSFTYKATDGVNFSNEVTVTLSVTAVNDAPVAVQDANYSVDADNTLTVNAANGVLTNDSDPDGDSITAVLVSGPSNGVLTLNDNGSFEYTPTNGFSGSDSFTYKANDTQLDSNQITVTIDVIGANTVDFHFSVNSNGVSVGGLTVDNEDIVAKLSDGDYGFVFDGSDMGLSGLVIDSFMVTGPDTILLSFTGSAGITGLGTVDDSDIIQFTGTFGADTTGTFSWYFDGSDVGLTTNGEDIDAFTILPDGSLLVSTAGGYSVPGASGSDEDLIQFTGTYGATTTGSWEIYFDGSDVGLSTSSSEDVNAVSVDSDGNILLSTRGNFSVSGVSGADEDIFVFVPTTLGSNTSGSFQSQLFFDGSAAGLAGTDIFGLSVAVDSNESPIAFADTYDAFDEDTTLIVDALTGVLANDSDPENDSLTAVLVSGPANGVLTLNDDGSFSYTPDENYNGSDSFTYKATDGVNFSNEVTVTLSVTAVNDAPVAVQDANYSVDADNTLTVNAANGVLTNDSDPDGDSITAVLVSGPSNGVLTLNDDGSFEYTPTNGFSGSDSFTYKANDTQLDSNQITVTIDVLPPNDPPSAVADVYDAFDEDTTLNVDAATGVLANDSDPENDSITAVLVSGPANGVLTLNDDGSFSYTPDENYNGSDSFTYKATDGVNFSNEVTVTLSVAAVNDAPVAVQDANYSVDADNTLTVNAANGVLTNDSDPDGDSITAVLVSGPSNGALTLNDNGSFDYTPTTGFSGSDSFTYKANDTQLDSNQITVTIDVIGNSGTKFFVVDSGSDDTFEYAADGSFVENYNLASSSAKGVTTTPDGSIVWVIDNNDYVYVYDNSGNLLGNWYASGLKRPEGIALDGNDLLIVDRGMDAVLRYTGAAAWRSGSIGYDTGFYLTSGNSRPYGITTDGTSFWVVDDQRSGDFVYKYSVDAGNYFFDGVWTLDSANSRPRGITIDPNDVNHLWIVDSARDDIFEYQNSVNRTGGSFAADQRYDLAAGNGGAQGIADPDSSLADSSFESIVGINTNANGFRIAVNSLNSVIGKQSNNTGALPWGNMAVQEFSDWRIEPVSNRISETLPTSFDSEFQLLRGSEQKFNETATALFENEDLVFDVSKQDNEENLLDDIYGNLELLGQVTGKFSLEWLDSQN